jgi:hypothetical protein
MLAPLERDERARVTCTAGHRQIAPVDRTFGINRMEKAGVREKPFERARITAVALLAADIRACVRRPIPRLKVIPARGPRIREVAIGAAAKRRV